ncbi:MAG: hypothetical protein IJ468_14275 [Lachnospiraceae bacterium]|nr:hypothetical protein [Lachnospiraceae bacterium]
MNQAQNHALLSYEETTRLNQQIDAILSSRCSAGKKIRQLEKLNQSVTTPLAKSRIAYLQRRLQAKRRAFIGRLLAAPFLLAYLLFMLNLTHVLRYPDQNLNPGFALPSATTVIYLLFLSPLAVLAVCLIRYFRSGGRR